MEKAIYKLIEIEEKAKNIISRANEEKIKLHNAYENDIADMEKDISSDNMNKIHRFQLQIDKEIENEKVLLEEKNKKQLNDLDLFYEKNHIAIVQKLFDNIINS